ncbi:hypothetical protein ACSS6W_002584 [Trichoderma asperelloides]
MPLWASALPRWYHGNDPAELLMQHSLSPPQRETKPALFIVVKLTEPFPLI